MPLQITPLNEYDIPSAVTCIQSAFAEDPYFQWVFPPSSDFNVARNRASLRARCLWGKRHALFHVAKDASVPDKVLGVGCWLVPCRDTQLKTWRSYLASFLSLAAWQTWYDHQAAEWELWVRQGFTNLYFFGRGGLSLPRYQAWKVAQATAQKEVWTDPNGYYFCNIITVLPEAQGRGIGRKLVEEVTKRADKEGRRCYLESSRRDPNVQVYERLGFQLQRQMSCKSWEQGDPGITLYCMVREPQGSIST